MPSAPSTEGSLRASVVERLAGHGHQWRLPVAAAFVAAIGVTSFSAYEAGRVAPDHETVSANTQVGAVAAVVDGMVDIGDGTGATVPGELRSGDGLHSPGGGHQSGGASGGSTTDRSATDPTDTADASDGATAQPPADPRADSPTSQTSDAAPADGPSSTGQTTATSPTVGPDPAEDPPGDGTTGESPVTTRPATTTTRATPVTTPKAPVATTTSTTTTTTRPTTTTVPPTGVVTAAVAVTPDYCEVQIGSGPLAGVEIHHYDGVFSSDYVFYNIDGDIVVWTSILGPYDDYEPAEPSIEWTSDHHGYEESVVYWVAGRSPDGGYSNAARCAHVFVP